MSLASDPGPHGTVDARKPFTAAQIYLRNLDQPMVYMVYTSHGKFQALALLPGRYEDAIPSLGATALNGPPGYAFPPPDLGKAGLSEGH